MALKSLMKFLWKVLATIFLSLGIAALGILNFTLHLIVFIIGVPLYYGAQSIVVIPLAGIGLRVLCYLREGEHLVFSLGDLLDPDVLTSGMDNWVGLKSILLGVLSGPVELIVVPIACLTLPPLYLLSEIGISMPKLEIVDMFLRANEYIWSEQIKDSPLTPGKSQPTLVASLQ